MIADSLRYDAVHEAPDVAMPYVSSHATCFTQARSGGCWTLPATASLLTGLLPHEHGATAQSRAIRPGAVLLPERLRAEGYRTMQITANPATTHIFGLDRGFDEMHRIWTEVPRRHGSVDTILSLLARPRVRRQLFEGSRDQIAGRLAEDVFAARAWMQSNAEVQFDRARAALERHQGREGAFLFVNLMESHFPYHIADTFEPSQEGLAWWMKEVMALFHLANQTRLETGRQHIPPEMLDALRRRQRRAWRRLAPMIDSFVEELHKREDTLVVFCGDHGDNFGEQGWEYHFANVNDAGNRVPLFVLEPGQTEGRSVRVPVSARDVHGTLLSALALPRGAAEIDLLSEPEASVPVIESFWYDKAGRTQPQFRYNQFSFLTDSHKYVQRQGEWLYSPLRDRGPEPTYEALEATVDPIEEAALPSEKRAVLRHKQRDFAAFAAGLAQA